MAVDSVIACAVRDRVIAMRVLRRVRMCSFLWFVVASLYMYARPYNVRNVRTRACECLWLSKGRDRHCACGVFSQGVPCVSKLAFSNRLYVSPLMLCLYSMSICFYTYIYLYECSLSSARCVREFVVHKYGYTMLYYYTIHIHTYIFTMYIYTIALRCSARARVCPCQLQLQLYAPRSHTIKSECLWSARAATARLRVRVSREPQN